MNACAGVQASLTGLYQTIEARLALYKPLVSLQGRLDLVLAQTAPADPLASHLAAGPLVSPHATQVKTTVLAQPVRHTALAAAAVCFCICGVLSFACGTQVPSFTLASCVGTPPDGQPVMTDIMCCLQMYHDEDEALQEVDVEDILALQGAPDIESELEDSAGSDMMSASDMSGDDSDVE